MHPEKRGGEKKWVGMTGLTKKTSWQKYATAWYAANGPSADGALCQLRCANRSVPTAEASTQEEDEKAPREDMKNLWKRI